ncbi:hypothetical protein [Dolichospermum sp. LEGE 00240]|uniref:hypothetical protein n=1 Tax=Dolichospermum sp. LEGE 00240 TaxID=1828603 RepID=UPI001D142FE1|nr:hypothetical protein [Dolichospermum sp. LEGE 00240]
MAEYQGILEDLEAQGAIAVAKKESATSYALTSLTCLDVLKRACIVIIICIN